MTGRLFPRVNLTPVETKVVVPAAAAAEKAGVDGPALSAPAETGRGGGVILALNNVAGDEVVRGILVLLSAWGVVMTDEEGEMVAVSCCCSARSGFGLRLRLRLSAWLDGDGDKILLDFSPSSAPNSLSPPFAPSLPSPPFALDLDLDCVDAAARVIVLEAYSSISCTLALSLTKRFGSRAASEAAASEEDMITFDKREKEDRRGVGKKKGWG